MSTFLDENCSWYILGNFRWFLMENFSCWPDGHAQADAFCPQNFLSEIVLKHSNCTQNHTFVQNFKKKNVFPFATSRDVFLFHVIRVIHSNKKFERNGCFFLISLIIIGLKIYVFPMFINSNTWLFFFLIHNRFQSIGSIKIYKKNLNNQSSTFP